MKNRLIFLIAVILLGGVFHGCDDDSSSNLRDLCFVDGVSTSINLNESVQLRLQLLPAKTPYDNAANPELLTWTSTDETVATVNAQGLATGLAAGKTQIRAVSADNSLSASIYLWVYATDQTSSLEKPLDQKIVFSKGVQLVRNSVIQGFDMDSENAIFYVQIAGTDEHQLNIIKSSPYTGTPAKHYENYMACSYFGHGTNIAIEESDTDRYVWIGCYGSRNSGANSYSSSQTVTRVKYEAGKVVTPTQCDEQYYIQGVRNIHPAIDAENDLIAFTSSGGSEKGRWFRIYRMSEIKALETTSVRLASLRYGGATSSDPEVTETPVVNVRDLSPLTPLGKFNILEGGSDDNAVGHYDFQGFDIKDDRIYYYEGEANNNDGKQNSNAFVTVFDFKGNIVRLRTRVAAASDMNLLATEGITTTGYMEAEGIRINNGKIYLGFASKSTDNIRRAVILQYDNE